MRTSLRRLLVGSAIVGGFTVLGIALSTATASAAEPGTTSGEDGIISGNQSGVTVTAPIDATGNQVTVIGDDNSVESSGSDSTRPAAGGGSTSGEEGVVSGNQSEVTVTAPIDLSGNQVTVIGDGNDTSSSGSDTTSGGTSATVGTTSGDDGTGSGNQTGVGVTAPVDVSCNQVTVIGDGNATACSGSSATTTGGTGGTGSTSGQDGTGSGNQTALDLTAPIDAEGNQVTVIGDDNTNRSPADSTGESSGEPAGPGGQAGGSDPGSGPGGTTTTSGGSQVPQGGAVITTAQGALPVASETVAGATILPRAGLSGSLQLLGLLGSLLLLAGAGLLLRDRRVRTT